MAGAGTDKTRDDAGGDAARLASPADERLHWQIDLLDERGGAALPAPGSDHEIVPEPAKPGTVPPAIPRPAKKRVLSLAILRGWVSHQIATEVRLGTGFVLLPVAFGLGAMGYFALPVEPAAHNIAVGLVIAVLGLWLAARRQAAALVMAGLTAAVVFGAGMAAGQLRTHVLATPMTGSAVTTTLSGQVIAVERRANGTARYTIDIVETRSPRLRYAPDRIRVTARTQDDRFRSGDGIEGRVRLTPPSGPFRPGGFDFAFHNYFIGIGANGFFLGAPEPANLASDPGAFQRLAAVFRNWRMDLGNRIIARSGQDAGAAVAAALVTGDKAPIPADVADALRLSGLAHILTISGLHMALVAGAVMVAIRAGLALFPGFASAHGTKKLAACWALAFVAVYLFLAGASVATQRSFIMLSVMLGALLIDRAAITMRNLAIAALIVMAIAPEAITGPSFQMSFAATAALIAVYAGATNWSDRSRDQRSFVARPAWQTVSVTVLRYGAGLAITAIVAGAATGLYSAYHFNRIAPYGLIANVLAVPLVSLVTMPLAVAGMLAMPFGLDGFVFSAMAWSVERVVAVADFVVSFSPSGAIGHLPKPAMLMGSAGLVTLCLLRSHLRWIGIVPLIAMAAMIADRPVPVALVTEDARQFGVLSDTGGEGGLVLAVNRSRPNGFTINQWQPAYQIGAIFKPESSDTLDWATAEPNPAGGAMICDDTACIARAATPAHEVWIAYVSEAADNNALTALCGRYDLIIHAYAPAERVCAGLARELTAQDLALKGSAAIHLTESPKLASGTATAATATHAPIAVTHAIGDHLRPWHDHRRFSRNARNLEPWKQRR